MGNLGDRYPWRYYTGACGKLGSWLDIRGTLEPLLAVGFKKGEPLF